MYSNVISYHLGNINLFHLKEKSYDLPSKRLRRIFSQMLQHLNRQFLVGPSGILQKSPTLKSSLHKVCEFKYTLKKKKKITTSNPSEWFVAKGIWKKKKKRKKPTHITLLLRTHYLYLRYSAAFLFCFLAIFPGK